MSDSGEMHTPHPTGVSIWRGAGPRVLTLLFLLYGFLVSIGLLGKAFAMFSGGFVDDLIASASNPLLGLFVGVLATTLVQSSSTTTSIVVAMVGSGSMPPGQPRPPLPRAGVRARLRGLDGSRLL